ncbi:MAG: hypothetical protein KAI59_02695 [Planctomycetes bacterium]|nr:hypothetical protein [Planctomycetota bacterium]
MRKKILLLEVAAVLILGLFAALAIAENFTLSDDDLMLLDYHFNHHSSSSEVIYKTDVEGPGVEFDIHFPDTNRQNHSITYVSCKNGGEDLVTGININDYDAFAIKFTLVSVNDSNYPDAGGSLVVGALINSGYSHSYRPEVISLQPGNNTTISSTKTDANNTSIIGFTAHFLTPDGWDPNGSTVRLLIEPAPDAEFLPQP